MMNDKSVLRNEKIASHINVGVARHSIVGTTVYGATLRNYIKKVKQSEENNRTVVIPQQCQDETTVKNDNTQGLSFYFTSLNHSR